MSMASFDGVLSLMSGKTVRIDTDVRKSVGSRERLVSTNVINNIVW
jgi:hypothetical protein